jgi:hypothetical protein
VLTFVRNPQPRSVSITTVHLSPDVHELVVFCPGCKALETLWLNDGWLTPTRKFKQLGKQVFHDCGTLEPCRLYRPS